MSHVTPCYKEEAKDFGPQIKALLEQHGPVLVRATLVHSCVWYRIIYPSEHVHPLRVTVL